MSIHTLREKIKGFRKNLVFVGVVAGTALAAFGAGYAARAEGHTEPLVAIACPDAAYIDAGAYAAGAPVFAASSGASHAPAAKPFVASKNGKSYYSSSCPAASRIKEGNKVYFSDEAAARSAGYAPSTACN